MCRGSFTTRKNTSELQDTRKSILPVCVQVHSLHVKTLLNFKIQEKVFFLYV